MVVVVTVKTFLPKLRKTETVVREGKTPSWRGMGGRGGGCGGGG